MEPAQGRLLLHGFRVGVDGEDLTREVVFAFDARRRGNPAGSYKRGNSCRAFGGSSTVHPVGA